MESYIRMSQKLPFALRDVRNYFISGDLLKRTTAILTLLDYGYQPQEAYRLLHAFDEKLTPWDFDDMVDEAKYLDRMSLRPRLTLNQELAVKSAG